MADIAKVITIIGSSPESFAKAADAAVQEAAKTVRGITGADVVSMSALVENDRIAAAYNRIVCDPLVKEVANRLRDSGFHEVGRASQLVPAGDDGRLG